MDIMNFSDLLDKHPEIVRDRQGLSFASHSRAADAISAYDRCGVILLREALPAPVVAAAGAAFRAFALSPEFTHARPNRNAYGSWHSPWSIRYGEGYPGAAVIAA